MVVRGRRLGCKAWGGIYGTICSVRGLGFRVYWGRTVRATDSSAMQGMEVEI